MSVIITKFDEFTRPLVAPLYAAAYAVLLSGPDKARVFFRLKKTSEATGLTSLKNARKEVPGLTWHPVQPTPWSQNSGGVTKDAKYYQYIDFERVESAWQIVGEGLDPYAAASNRPTLHGAELPPTAGRELQEIDKLMEDMRDAMK